MNKKFLSAILFGALMVTSTGTFVSCKDYDDDIDAINKELTDVKSQIAALQAKVDAGKWITSVSSNAAGVTINLSDGSSLNITNGKDGAQGAAGQDGKNGTVVTVNEEGYLCLDGVATEYKLAQEAPAAKPCVKLSEEGELMILEGDDYVGTGIKACGVTALNTNGVWTITVGDDVITVPGSAALTGIEIENGEIFTYYYGINAKDAKWGFKNEKVMPAGFYTKLSKDLTVLLNPAEADATVFTYTFKNSKNEAANVAYFGKARPYTGSPLTKAASASGLWTLPAEVSAFDVADAETLRREFYLNFKQNDQDAYAMALEAIDGMGNTSVRSSYDYALTLAAAPASVSVNSVVYNKIGDICYPEFTNNAVYAYEIRLNQSTTNLRKAELFGVDVSADGQSYSAMDAIAAYDGIKFDVAYVTIGGKAYRGTFTAYFNNEAATPAVAEVRLPAFKSAFDAVLPSDYKSGEKSFYLTKKLDVTETIKAMTEEQFANFEEYFKNQSIGENNMVLLGGESTGEENYNEYNRNSILLDNISGVSITHDSDNDKYYFNFKLRVSSDLYDGKDEVAGEQEVPEAWEDDVQGWIEFNNFQLNTAYQLNMTIFEETNPSVEVMTIAFPFELSNPTWEINQVPGDFSEWGSVYRENTAGKVVSERALYVYGELSQNDNYMALPLYDSFTTWKPKTSKRGEFEDLVDNAEYYNLAFDQENIHYRILGQSENNQFNYVNFAEDEASLYSVKTDGLTTVLTKGYIPTVLGWEALKDSKGNVIEGYDKGEREFYTRVKVDYREYGVYSRYSDRYYKGEPIAYDDFDGAEADVMNEGDFNLVFASWLKHSTIEMQEEEYETGAGTGFVFISNEDLNMITPKDDAFYLFDDVDSKGVVETRKTINKSAFNESDRPFTTVISTDPNYLYGTDSNGVPTCISAYDTDGGNDEDFGVKIMTQDPRMHNTDGEYYFKVEEPDQDVVQIYPVQVYGKKKQGETTYEAIPGGMLIQLPAGVTDKQTITVRLTLSDAWGYEKTLDINVVQIKD